MLCKRIRGNERASGHAEREERAFDPPGQKAQGESARAKGPGGKFISSVAKRELLFVHIERN